MAFEGLGELRVLVVEDNNHMGVILRTLLQSFGVKEILEARDAASAFELCCSNQPDLALVDYELGDITGAEFARLIRQADDSPNRFLPIILITAHSERSRVQEAVNAGIDEFVVKPVSARVLLERLKAVVVRRRAFIETDEYFGPDRRRRRDDKYKGPWRRSDDAELDAFDDDGELGGDEGGEAQSG